MKKLLLLLMTSLFSAALFAQKLDISPPLQRQMVIIDPPQVIFSTKGMVKMYWGPFFYGRDHEQVVFVEGPHIYIRQARLTYKPFANSRKDITTALPSSLRVSRLADQKTNILSTRIMPNNAGVRFPPLKIMPDSTSVK